MLDEERVEDLEDAPESEVEAVEVSELADGAFLRGFSPGRTSAAVDAAGTLHVGRIAFAGTWRGSGQRRPLDGVNQALRGNQTMLYTPAWGAQTPAVSGGVAIAKFA